MIDRGPAWGGANFERLGLKHINTSPSTSDLIPSCREMSSPTPSLSKNGLNCGPIALAIATPLPSLPTSSILLTARSPLWPTISPRSPPQKSLPFLSEHTIPSFNLAKHGSAIMFPHMQLLISEKERHVVEIGRERESRERACYILESISFQGAGGGRWGGGPVRGGRVRGRGGRGGGRAGRRAGEP